MPVLCVGISHMKRKGISRMGWGDNSINQKCTLDIPECSSFTPELCHHIDNHTTRTQESSKPSKLSPHIWDRACYIKNGRLPNNIQLYLFIGQGLSVCGRPLLSM